MTGKFQSYSYLFAPLSTPGSSPAASLTWAVEHEKAKRMQPSPVAPKAVPDPVTIQYTYDALHRLTAADYSDGRFYHYTYDKVGNRLTQQTQFTNSAYTYDDANRLTSVDGVPYTWDNNGNLLSDSENTYTYDAARAAPPK